MHTIRVKREKNKTIYKNILIFFKSNSDSDIARSRK